MNAQVIMHPSATQRGIENARTIIMAPDGAFDDAEVLDACEFLMEHGDPWDVMRAKELQKVIVAIYVRKANTQAEPDELWELAPHDQVTLFEYIACAYALIMIGAALWGVL